MQPIFHTPACKCKRIKVRLKKKLVSKSSCAKEKKLKKSSITYLKKIIQLILNRKWLTLTGRRSGRIDLKKESEVEVIHLDFKFKEKLKKFFPLMSVLSVQRWRHHFFVYSVNRNQKHSGRYGFSPKDILNAEKPYLRKYLLYHI